MAYQTNQLTKKSESDQLAAWNLSSHLIQQIGYLLQSASSHYRNGDFQNSFFDTQEVRLLIHNDLTSVEDKQLDKLETNIHKAVRLITKLNYESEGQDPRITKIKVVHTHYLNKYRKLISELLGKYGYGMGKKEDSSKMF